MAIFILDGEARQAFYSKEEIMIKQIIIKVCNECPYFIPNDAIGEWLTDYCSFPGRDLKSFPKEENKKTRPIPKWCPLEDYRRGE
jgi:hypothetical protein